MVKKILMILLIVGLMVSVIILNLKVSFVSSYTYTGHRWRLNCTEINIFATPFNQEFQSAANSARQKWNQSGANFTFILNDASNNYIDWEILPSNIIGLTQVDLDSDGYIENCISYLNVYIPYSTNGEPNCYDVESVFLHEFGHWLSLGYSNIYQAVMFRELLKWQLKRALHQDDINGIKSIYGIRKQGGEK